MMLCSPFVNVRMQFMKENGVAVDCLNRRYASTNLHGIASHKTVVKIFVNTSIFTVRFDSVDWYSINKIDTAMCDDFALASIFISNCCVYGNVYMFYLLNEICVTSHRLYIYIYIYVCVYIYHYISKNIF